MSESKGLLLHLKRMLPSDHLSLNDAVKYSGLSKHTLYGLSSRRVLKVYKIGRSIYFSKSDIDRSACKRGERIVGFAPRQLTCKRIDGTTIQISGAVNMSKAINISYSTFLKRYGKVKDGQIIEEVDATKANGKNK